MGTTHSRVSCDKHGMKFCSNPEHEIEDLRAELNRLHAYGAPFPYRLRLKWFQRKDGLWNADCPCGASLCGAEEHMRIGHEAWHFADEKRAVVHTRIFSREEHERLEQWFELSERTYAAQRTLDHNAASKIFMQLDPQMQELRNTMLKGLR